MKMSVIEFHVKSQKHENGEEVAANSQWDGIEDRYNGIKL